MKKMLGSWKFYVIIISLGFALWVVPEVFDLIKPRPLLKTFNKSIPFMMIEPSKSFYQEIKEWGKIIGQLLAGIGGVGSSVKILIGLFHRRKSYDD